MHTLLKSLPFNPNDEERGIIFVTPDFLIELSNEKFCEIMGMSRTEVHGLDMRKFIHPDDLAIQMPDLLRVIEGEADIFATNQRIFKKDGAILWAHITYYRFTKSNGDWIYGVVVYEKLPTPV